MGTEGMVNLNLSNPTLSPLPTREKIMVPDILVSNFVFGKCKGLSYESIRDFIDRMVDGQEFG